MTAEYQIRLHKDNAVELRFNTTNREETGQRAAVLRAVGVRAEVGKTYDKSRSHDVWYINLTTDAHAAESVHGAARKAVAEFLRQCREAGPSGTTPTVA